MRAKDREKARIETLSKVKREGGPVSERTRRGKEREQRRVQKDHSKKCKTPLHPVTE